MFCLEDSCGFGVRNSTKAEQMCRMKKKRFRWKVLDHPPYSPDLAPSDFPLFGARKKHFSEQMLKFSKPA
ncbi:hypothetical protein TNCV_783181 [Trichonephila clavipes]|nr:hypothetical protein TNCV_783181 [Trichonephila clavipes]